MAHLDVKGLGVGDKVAISPVYSIGHSLYVLAKVDRVTKTQLILRSETGTWYRFMRNSGREYGLHTAWRARYLCDYDEAVEANKVEKEKEAFCALQSRTAQLVKKLEFTPEGKKRLDAALRVLTEEAGE